MITVFGASGRIGGHVVRQALDSGHEVTAVVRSTPVLPAHPRLTVHRADLSSPDALTDAVAGATAVISALGPPDTRPNTICTDGIRVITAAMAETGTARLLTVSAAGAFPDPADGPLTRHLLKPALNGFLRHHYADIRSMEHLIRSTDLTWTIVRGSRLTDGPLTGVYRTGRSLPRATSISRADLAHYLLTALPATAPDTVTISY